MNYQDQNNSDANYKFEQFSQDAITVFIDTSITNTIIPEHLKLIADLRDNSNAKKILLQKNLNFRPEIIELEDLGFDYIDIGVHSDWIAAEILITSKLTEEHLHKGGKILQRIKKFIA